MSDAFRQIGRGTINLKGSSIINFLVKSCQRRSCEQVRKPFYIWSIIGKDLNGFSVVFVMISVCRKSESIRPSDSPSMTIETVSSPPISLFSISYPCHWCLAEKAYLLLWGMCGIGPENISLLNLEKRHWLEKIPRVKFWQGFGISFVKFSFKTWKLWSNIHLRWPCFPHHALFT